MRVLQASGQARWADKRIVFVSGKGGVGKSLIAAAIALEQSQAGRRVLLAEIGETSYYQDFWNLPKVGHEPVRLKQGFDLALWSGESCLREYVLYYLRMERLYRLFFENKVMRALISVAPGLTEVAILGKITSGLRKVGPALDYDLIVVDCYATGHTLALFHAPQGFQEVIQFGPMGHHSQEMRAVLRNPRLCGYEVVTLLEEMPIVETTEFIQKLKDEIGVEAGVIANKILPLPVSERELHKLEAGGPKGLGEFSRYLLKVAERQDRFMGELGRKYASVLRVPLIFSTDPDELVRAAGDAFDD